MTKLQNCLCAKATDGALAPLICTGDMMIIDTNAPLQHGDIAAQTDGKPVIYYTHNAPILGKVIGITRTEV